MIVFHVLVLVLVLVFVLVWMLGSDQVEDRVASCRFNFRVQLRPEQAPFASRSAIEEGRTALEKVTLVMMVRSYW